MTKSLHAPIILYIAKYSQWYFHKIWQKNTGFSRPEEILELFNCQTTGKFIMVSTTSRTAKTADQNPLFLSTFQPHNPTFPVTVFQLTSAFRTWRWSAIAFNKKIVPLIVHERIIWYTKHGFIPRFGVHDFAGWCTGPFFLYTSMTVYRAIQWHATKSKAS